MVEATIVDSHTHKSCAYIITPAGEYLLQRRSGDMYDGSSGRLTLFGGGVDVGETIIQGLARELQEELELDITKCTVVYIGCHVGSLGVRFEIYGVTMSQSQDLVLHEGDEIIKVTRDQLYDPEITSWFYKINKTYLNHLSQHQ